MGSHTQRIVVLVDMDCFYCQVEEKLDSSLVGKPIAVVQYNAWKGGGLIAVNYLARDMGVTRHMRGDEAKEKCPDIVLVSVPSVRGKADLTKYREGGKRVAEVLQTFTPLLQRASVDEAYLDITEVVDKKLQTLSRKVTKQQDLPNSYVVGCDIEDFIENVYTNDFNNEHNLKLLIGGTIVEEIRAAVYEKTGYRCSAGIAHNKILAKLACGINKPNKQTLLPHDSVEEMYKTLPIRKIKSLGGKFGNTLAEDLKIKFMSELVQFSEKELMKKYDDKTAIWLYNIARGIDLEPVETRLISKSIGCCKNFPGKTALLTTEDVTHWLSELSEEISERLEQDIQENNRKAKQIVLSFAQEVNRKDVHSSRSMVLNSYEAKKILDDTFETLKKHTQKPDGSFGIKFLGLSAGKFENIKNINDISTFFKVITKKENVDLENTNITNNDELNNTESSENVSKNKSNLTSVLNNVKNQNTNFVKTTDENIENISEKKIGILNYFNTNTNGTKNTDFSSSKLKKGKRKRTIMNFFNSDSKEITPDSTNQISKNDIPIIRTSPSNEISKKTLKTEDKKFSETKIFDVTQETINLSDIENDAEISLDEKLSHRSNECYSDSTVEEDFTEILKNKIEFPFRYEEKPNCNKTDRKSPIFGQGNELHSGKSFFMRYIKKMETKTHEEKSEIKNFEPIAGSSKMVNNGSNLDIINSKIIQNIEPLPGSSKMISNGSNLDSKIENIEPLAGSSKMVENEPNLEVISLSSNDSLKIGNEENNFPMEVIYSDNSNSSIDFDENKENNYKSCPDCGENVPKYMLVSHMDHHVALRLMEEEKKIFQKELELHKQTKLNKTPTKKEVKTTKSKPPKTKSVKRKQPENNTNISSFFVQKSDNIDNMEVCQECGKNIDLSEFTSHLDFHAAKKLHIELNPVKVITKNNIKINKKNVNAKSVNNNSLTNFFKPK